MPTTQEPGPRRVSDGPAPEPELPSLITPKRVQPGLDLTAPENAPDAPDGEWTRAHMIQFLARQPRVPVYIPKEPWESKHNDCFLTIGYNGIFFTIIKGRSELVPAPIAEIVEQSQEEFPTSQSKAISRQITDIRDLPPGPNGMAGPEIRL